MKNSLLLACLAAFCLSAEADDVVKGRVVSDVNKKPVANAMLSVEYPDTIMRYEADRKGRFKFDPMSYPFTITVRREGMTEAVYGLMSKPDKPLLLEMTPDPALASGQKQRRKPDWASNMPPRLSSKFIIHSGYPKK